MKFFSKLFSNKLLWVFAILCLFAWLFSGCRTSKQEVSKSRAVQATKVEATKKPAEKPQGTEAELSKKMLDETVDLETRLEVGKAWAEKHVSNAEKRCAAYKKKVYGSDLDPKVKDLLWGAAIVASEYCWKVDVHPTPKVTKPKQKKAISSLK